MGNPIIAVAPLFDLKKRRLWMVGECLDSIRGAGGLPVVLPLGLGEFEIEKVARSFDGFLFPGGPDIAPELYGEEKLSCCGDISPERDALELPLLRAVLELDKPVFGICRGCQLINVALGGTLWQDMAEQQGSPALKAHDQEEPFGEPSHSVEITEGTLLAKILGTAQAEVNSLHHQGLREAAPGLRIAARAPDKTVEAVEIVGRSFALAVQWHPELSYASDERSRALFAGFVGASRRGAADKSGGAGLIYPEEDAG